MQIANWAVGWVDIGIGTKVPLRFVTYLSKVTKINKQSVLTQKILGHALYSIEVKIFFSQYGLHGYQKTQHFM
jgi:hypothetical protein